MELLDLLRSRINRMDNLITGVLELSKVGKVAMQSENLDMEYLINEIFYSINTKPSVKLVFEDAIPHIEADKIKMNQLFQNLISNAIKYNNKDEGVVKIGYQNDDEFHIFYVEDNGSGIEEKYFHKIFMIFQTLEGNNDSDSTGVGLTVVKKIIDLYEGQITVTSKINEWTRFTFSLKKKLNNI